MVIKLKQEVLHKDPIEFKPQFKLLLLCNALPKVPPDDEGTWRRLEVVEFQSKFVDNPKEDNEYPRDLYLSEKLKEWKETFMAYLIEVYYKKYKENGLVIPKEIIKYTEEYQKNCDIYIDFLNDTVEKSEPKDCVTYDDLHDEYKDWHNENYNTGKFATRRELKIYMEKKFRKKKFIPAGTQGV